MTNLNKKFALLICLVLSLVMLFAFSSCGGNEPPANDDSQNSTQTGTNTDTGTDSSTDTSVDSEKGDSNTDTSETQSCIVTFDSNGGTEISAQSVEMNKKATEPTAPTRAGYTFEGWYMGEEKWSFIGYVVTEDMTLVAKWTANENTLSFNANGGSGTMDNMTIETDSQANLTANSFERVGYTFIGWSITASGSVEYTDGASYTMGAEASYSLYAVWEAINYDITYELNGGTNNTENPNSYNVEQSFELKAPTKEGYTFVGWYSDSSFNNNVTDIAQGTTGEKAFYAKWTPNENTLAFNANGGEGVMANMTISTGNSSVLGECTYTRAGYTFKGWSTNASGGVEYETGDTYVMGTNPSYTLYAVWQANNNTLVFDANGGSGSMSNMVASTGSSVTLTSNAFTRAGYIFKGWSTTENGTVEYGENATYTMGTSSVNTLYAVWQANENTLVFNANGGNGAMENMTIATDSQAKLSANAFVRAGYTFIGWSTTADGEVEYLDSVSYTMGASSTYTLYAVWQKNINGLIFDGNGATSGTPSTMEIETGKTIILPQNTFAKTGYTFRGWSTEKDGAVVYTDGASYTMGTEGTYHLYAVWQANNNTLAFNANGGNGNIDNMTVATDSKITLPQNTFTKTGYTFIGWSTTKGGEVEYTDGASYTMGTESVNTLYAVWQANENTLIFNANGGTGTMSNMTIATDASKNLTLNAFTKTGYTFKGWATSTNGSVKYADGASYTMGTSSSYTLYAIWEVETYNITYELNGGTNNTENQSTYTVEQSVSLKNPSKAGYTFAGWYSDSSFNNKVTEITLGTTGNKTFYAKWTANENTLIFNANGGTGTMSNMTIATDASKNLTLNAFTKTGYTFKGWATSTNGSVKYADGASYTMGTSSSYTLYAIWEVETYNITYELNGGTNNTENQSTYTVEQSVSLKNPSKAGYTFAGWYSDSSFNNKVTEITLGTTGNKTFYAKWEAIEYDITYELNGGTNTTENKSIYTVEQSVSLKNPSKAGYTFVGWYSDSSFNNKVTEITLGTTGNKTFYAKWTANENILVFNANGGEGTMPNMTIATDVSKNLTLNAFTRTGYTFKGWATSTNGSVKYADGASYTMGTNSSYTLYAVWQANENTLVFNANGGSGTMSNMIIPTDSTVTLNSNEFTNNGLDFLGWATSVSGSVVYEDGASYTMGANNTYTLYAVWGVMKYDITYELNGGTNNSNNPSQYTKDDTITLENPTYPNSYLDFVGWYTDSAFENPITEIKNSNGDITLYAKWVTSSKAFVFTEVEGGYSITDLNYYIDTVIIPETYNGLPVISIGSYAFYNCTSLTSVTIPNSVTSIGDHAFHWCTSLTSVTIPNSVTSIGDYAFHLCTSLTSVTIGNSVTTIGSYAISGCISLVIYCEAESQPSTWDSYWNFANYPVVWNYLETITQNGIVYAITANGEATVISYTEDIESNVVIPSEINGNKVVSVLSKAFYDCTSLTSVTIPDSVTTIGSSAFWGCTSLTSVTIGNSVTSIGNFAFYNCNSFTNVTIPNSVTSIGDYAFYHCTSLTSITVDGNNTNYKSIDGVLYSKDGTTLICYPAGKQNTSFTIPSSVTTIEDYAFYGCTSLTSITIPDSVTSIGDSAFEDCTSLTSIEIPDSVTTIGNDVFYNCTSLTSITIPDSVTTIGSSAFDGCTSLTSVTIGNSVTTIGSFAFDGCTSLTSVTIGNSVTTIGSSAFDGCTSLTSITIPDSVTSIGDNAFYSCDSLTSVTIGNSVTTIGSSAFRNCTSLTSITIPDSVTTIGSHAFDGCTSLTSIIIPDSVTSIGISAFVGCTSLVIYCEAESQPSTWDSDWNYTNCLVVWNYLETITQNGIVYAITANGEATVISYTEDIESNVVIPSEINGNKVVSVLSNAFYDCTSLTSVTIGNSVTTIGSSAFEDCTSLTSVTIGNGVTTIGDYAFADCDSLTSIIIPDSVTSIGIYAFDGCTSLTSITIPDSVTTIGSFAFWGCTSLTSVTIGNGVTTIGDYAFADCDSLTSIIIPDSVTTIESHAFYNCTSLTSVTIGNSVTTIEYSAFEDCTSLTSVTIGNSVTTIEYSAFEDCTSLTSVTIGNSVTTIGSYAFRGCTSLTSIIIPDSVTSIGSRAFYNCTSLTSITIPDSVTTIGNNAFAYCSSLVIYCEAESQPSTWDSDWNYTNCPVVWNYLETITQNGIVYAITANGEATVISYTEDIESNVVIPSEINGNKVVSVLSNAFYGCTSLTSVTIPDSVTTIGSSAFWGCTSLTSVTIGNSVTSIGNSAFYNCNSLGSVNYLGTLEQWCNISFRVPYTNPLNNGAKLYLNGTLVTDLVIPSTVTEIKDYAFCGCTSLTSVTIPDSVTSIGIFAFANCTSLISVTIPDSVTSIGKRAFAYCSSLVIYCEAESQPSTWDSDWNYTNCPVVWNYLETITQNGIVYAITANGEATVISYTEDIESNVVIPSEINGNKVVSVLSNAFYDCNSLTSITIPDSVTTIGTGAFNSCYKLVEIYNLSSLNITAGTTANGYVGYYAKAIHTSLEEASILKTTADGYVFAVVSDSEIYLIGYFGNDTELILPESYNGNSYSIREYAFNKSEKIRSVTIPNGVTTIEDYAFYGCTGLTSFVIPNSVTTIEDYAFYGCTSLTSITIPDSVTTIGSHAFDGCISLTSVTIPDSVTSIGDSAFEGCISLTSVTIPDSVTSIGDSAFRGCTSLTSITIPDSVTSIGSSAFRGCTSLTSITIPDSVTTIGSSAFSGCTSLTSITIPDSVTTIGSSAFRGCTSLTSITIPDGVTSIGDSAFEDCTSLIEINFNATAMDDLSSNNYYVFYNAGKNGEGIKVTIGKNVTKIPAYLFYNCTSLTSVTIGNSVTSIGSFAFWGCTSLTSITIPDSVTTIGSHAFYNCTSLTSVTIPDSVTSIGDYAFYGCTSLTSIEIPDSVTTIGSRAFYNCTSLTSVTIGNSVTTIGSYAFYNCTSLTSVTIGNSVTSIGSYAFYGCNLLTSITIPDSVTTIGDYAFADCDSLTSIIIPDSVTTIGDCAFYGCNLLTSITIPDSVTTIGNNAFYKCASLTSIIVDENNTTYKSIDGVLYSKDGITLILYPKGKTDTSITIPDSVTTIENYAFYGCSSLTSVTIPNSVTSIGDYAFNWCTSLTSVTIGNSVTTIGSYAFNWCTSLTSVTIGNSVTTIGSYAFSGCISLTSVTIPDSVTSIGSYAFSPCNLLTSVTFENPNGWWCSSSSSISSSALASTSTAAKYLTFTYDDYDWKRS